MDGMRLVAVVLLSACLPACAVADDPSNELAPPPTAAPDGPTTGDSARSDARASMAGEPVAPASTATLPVRTLESRAVSLTLPDGWDGVAVRGMLLATSVPGGIDAERPPAGTVRLQIQEFGERAPGSALVPEGTLPLRIAPDTWPGPAEQWNTALPPGVTGAARDLRIGGRHLYIAVTYGAAPVPAALAEATNDVLATLVVGPAPVAGDPLPPPAFPVRPGWHVGGSEPAPPQPEGDQAEAWASTIPYRDDPLELPPHATLEALPADGIVIWFGISRSPQEAIWGRGDERMRPMAEPYRLPRPADGGCCWEGQIGELALYRIAGRDPRGYTADVWIWFGRPDPPAGQRARADAMLGANALPTWPARP
jgi:hypothetical protein